jgi:hypothetical protein
LLISLKTKDFLIIFLFENDKVQGI